MLGAGRDRQAQADASYAVVWANLRKRFPELRTILIAAASSRDDPGPAAIGLAQTIAQLDDTAVLVMVLDSAMPDRREPESPHPAVTAIGAQSPDQVRLALSHRRGAAALSIVVAAAPQTSRDCIAVAGEADAAILAATAGRTPFAEAGLAAEMLRQTGLPVAAAVLMRAPARSKLHPAPARRRRRIGRGDAIAEFLLASHGETPAVLGREA